MEENQFQKIQGWFETLDRKVEGIRSEVVEVRSEMVTKQQFENRFQALLTAVMNLHERVESYKNQQDAEIRLIKRAIHDLEEEVKGLRERS